MLYSSMTYHTHHVAIYEYYNIIQLTLLVLPLVVTLAICLGC